VDVSGQEVALSRSKAAQRAGGGGSGESRDRTRDIMAWLVYLSVSSRPAGGTCKE
jgi:hypothetical protein